MTFILLVVASWLLLAAVVGWVLFADEERFGVGDLDYLWPEGWTVCDHPEHDQLVVHSAQHRHAG